MRQKRLDRHYVTLDDMTEASIELGAEYGIDNDAIIYYGYGVFYFNKGNVVYRRSLFYVRIMKPLRGLRSVKRRPFVQVKNILMI